MPTVYVVKVRGHSEFSLMTTAAESLDSVARLYVNTHDIPVNLVNQISIFDCYTGTEYDVIPKEKGDGNVSNL